MALKRNGESRASPPRLLRQLTTTRLSVPPTWDARSSLSLAPEPARFSLAARRVCQFC